MKCKTCEGIGEVITLENQSPLGSGMIWLEEIVDDCPDCTGKGNCPNCGIVWDDRTFDFYLDVVYGKFICPNCHWVSVQT